MKIYKYELEPNNMPVLMPCEAYLLSVGFQGDYLYVWALVDEDETEVVEHQFFTYATGEKFVLPHGKSTFIGTAHTNDLVFHVFYKGVIDGTNTPDA